MKRGSGRRPSDDKAAAIPEAEQPKDQAEGVAGKDERHPEGQEDRQPHTNNIASNQQPQQQRDARAPLYRRQSTDVMIQHDANWTQDKDLEVKRELQNKENVSWPMTLRYAYMALGIVYGDIGTSPLYVFNNIFVELKTDGGLPSYDDVMGATSLIIWTIFLIVFVKYGCIVLLADDNGEGGTFALYSILSRTARLDAPSRVFDKKDLTLRQYRSGQSFSGRGRREGLPVTSKDVTEDVAEDADSQTFVAPNKYAGLLHNSNFAAIILLVVVLGATAMVIGDGILTPAQSVLAAITGLGNQNNYHQIHLSNGVIVGISCSVLAFLYVFQWVGTAHLSWAFSPVVVAWLLFNMLIGIYNIAHWHPGVFAALSPHFAFKFLIDNGHNGWVMLGGVILSVTGAEAMYADLGHFTRRAIQLGLFVAVLPSLLFTYLGQAAYLIRFPSAVDSVYYNSLPHPIYWPMFVVATLASIVASQAMITAAFSIIRQSMTLGCFPRMKVMQTNQKLKGQIYIPEINYLLMVLSIAAVGGFQTLDRIGSAYGVAVTFVFFITDILFALVMLAVWECPWYLPLIFFIFFGALDGVYLTATLNKFTHGGWFPLAVALGIFLISAIWTWGQQQRQIFLAKASQKRLEDFLHYEDVSKEERSNIQTNHAYTTDAMGDRVGVQIGRISVTAGASTASVARVPGMGLVNAEYIQGVPRVFENFLLTMPAMYRICVFVTVRQVAVPWVSDDERYLVADLEYPGFYRCVCRFGYMERVNLSKENFGSKLVEKIKAMLQPKDMFAPWRDQLAFKINRKELIDALEAKQVFITGRVDLVAGANLNIIKKLVLEYFYLPMERNCRKLIESWDVEKEDLLEVGMVYKVGDEDKRA